MGKGKRTSQLPLWATETIILGNSGTQYRICLRVFPTKVPNCPGLHGAEGFPGMWDFQC